MDPKVQARLKTRARIVKAMAHPTRLFIVDELSRRERCVCELRDMIGADISTVSKHLSVLRRVGLVDCRREGVNVYYRIDDPTVFTICSTVCDSLERQVETEKREIEQGRAALLGAEK